MHTDTLTHVFALCLCLPLARTCSRSLSLPTFSLFPPPASLLSIQMIGMRAPEHTTRIHAQHRMSRPLLCLLLRPASSGGRTGGKHLHAKCGVHSHTTDMITLRLFSSFPPSHTICMRTCLVFRVRQLLSLSLSYTHNHVLLALIYQTEGSHQLARPAAVPKPLRSSTTQAPTYAHHHTAGKLSSERAGGRHQPAAGGLSPFQQER